MFNRFSICDAHCVLEWDYNVGGILQERPSNQRRNASTGVQLARMRYRPAMDLSYDTLDDDAKEIYLTNVLRWNLPIDEEQRRRIRSFFAHDWLIEHYPHILRAA